MSEKRLLSSEATGKITGAPSGQDFTRSCFVVHNHQDGTGTIALNWYEMSDGRDCGSSDVFVRTELETALQIVRLLNAQLPGRVHAAEQLDWLDEEH
jgi:hypothetical protein